MYFIYTDSSIEPTNPGGILTWAYIVYSTKEKIFQDVQISGWGNGMTNNVGEYQGVVAACLWLLRLPHEQVRPAVINSDSQLVVKQCTQVWGCRNAALQKYQAMILKAVRKYEKSITFRWIPREKNKEADELSRSLYTPKMMEIMKRRKEDIIFDGDDLSF